MALSDYDILAFDENGQSTRGVFESPAGVIVEFYKDFLYVGDERAWREGSSYLHPTVMKIEQGELNYMDVRVRAIRGPQDGVYAVVSSGTTYTYEGSKPFRCMIGVGCNGYRHYFADGTRTEPEIIHWSSDDPVQRDEQGRKIETRWEGVSDDALACLRDMIADDDELPEALRHTDMSTLVRFNQGDAYIADHVGAPVPATTPGESEQPILIQALTSEQGDE